MSSYATIIFNESDSEFSVTNQREEDLWEDLSNAGTRPNRQ